MLNAAPPTLRVAVRAAPLLAAMVYAIVPLPVPEVGPVMVKKGESLESE